MFGVFWIFFKITGLAPWKINKRGAFRYNWWSLLTGYGLLIGSIAHDVYSNVSDLEQAIMRAKWETTATVRVVGYIDLGTMCIASFVCLVAATSQTKNIFRIVEIFRDLKAHHNIPNNPFRFRQAIGLGLLMTSLVTYDLTVGGLAVCAPLLGAWYLRFFLYGSEFMFISSVLTLCELFEKVNHRLRTSVQSESTAVRDVQQVLPIVDCIKGYDQIRGRLPLNSPETLRELSATHWKLCTIGKEINAAFNGQLLAFFVTFVVRMVTVPYFVFLMVDTDFPVNTEGLLSNVGWTAVHALQLCLIVWPCSLASDEARETSTIIVHNLNKPLPADSRNQMEMFLVQLTNHKLNFNVYNMFAVDLTVMTSVAGAVTTYLVILIQFQNSQHQRE